MNRVIILVSTAMLSVVLLSGWAGAQVRPQTVEIAKVDVQKLAAGYRGCAPPCAAGMRAACSDGPTEKGHRPWN
jgi:hypothetical protein